MKNINDVIEIAIRGGWEKPEGIALDAPLGDDFLTKIVKEQFFIHVQLSNVVLDPLFWQALGNELGWMQENRIGNVVNEPQARAMMRWMSDFIWEGGTAEEYLISLIPEDYES